MGVSAYVDICALQTLYTRRMGNRFLSGVDGFRYFFRGDPYSPKSEGVGSRKKKITISTAGSGGEEIPRTMASVPCRRISLAWPLSFGMFLFHALVLVCDTVESLFSVHASSTHSHGGDEKGFLGFVLYFFPRLIS